MNLHEMILMEVEIRSRICAQLYVRKEEVSRVFEARMIDSPSRNSAYCLRLQMFFA